MVSRCEKLGLIHKSAGVICKSPANLNVAFSKSLIQDLKSTIIHIIFHVQFLETLIFPLSFIKILVEILEEH